MIQEIFDKLSPYLIGFRIASEAKIVDVILKKNWDPELLGNQSVSVKASNNKEGYYMYYGTSSEATFDDILQEVRNVVDGNIEREKKEELFKDKINELKDLFNSKDLKDLKNLSFELTESLTIPPNKPTGKLEENINDPNEKE